MEKLESIVALGIVLLILIVFFAVNINNDDVQLKNSLDNGVTRSISSNDIYGTYNVKGDQNTRLVINEDGSYSFNLDICSGHLELKGVYELRDKNLYLINRTSYEEYENLNNNTEFHFTVNDDDTLKLEENLECVFSGTLFEK
jgi:hypothetical protein